MNKYRTNTLLLIAIPKKEVLSCSKLPVMMKSIEAQELSHPVCTGHLRSIQDTLDVINGKWKISIIAGLTFGKKRFMELQRDIEGIGAKMLSKELRELELNELITRTVYDTRPVTVEYELSPYGKTLQPIINELSLWGEQHRKKIMRKKS